ncbi:MAG: VCBS repeat-containing protein, partial [Prevotella sp.]|nr:VCBS repeat-containing protein [Prevotella sp.]
MKRLTLYILLVLAMTTIHVGHIHAQIPIHIPDTTQLTPIDPFEPLDTTITHLTDSLLELTFFPDSSYFPDISSSSDKPVGSPAGSFSVSPMGAAQYNVAIEVPQGFGKMTPSLSISYNSQSGMGLAGYGFNISGLSVITRGMHDLAHDSIVYGITYSSSDAFFLDNKRLLVISGNAGQDNCVYSPEGDPFTRVIQHNSGIRPHFEVHTPDGITYQYGYTIDSKQTFVYQSSVLENSWYVNRAEDSWGNYIEYNYATDQLFVYPVSITYGNNSRTYTGQHYTIDFSYTSLNAAAQPFRLKGVEGKIDKLLTEIVSRKGSSIYRRYELLYNAISDNSYTKFPRLIKIKESNIGNQTLNPINFSWDFLPNMTCQNTLPSINLLTPNNYLNVHSRTFLPIGDFSGDGLNDLAVFSNVSASLNGNTDYRTFCEFYSSNIGSNGSISFTDSLRYDLGAYFSFADLSAQIGNPFSMDFDGDGIMDFLFPDFTSDFGGYYFYLNVIYGDEIRNRSRFRILMAKQPIYTSNMPKYASGDIDGDGKGEFITIEDSGNGGNYPCCIFKGSRNHLEGNIIPFSLSLTSAPQKILLNDYNGDGLLDLLVLHSNGYSLFLNNAPTNSPIVFSNNNKIEGNDIADAWRVSEGDFNGDGLPDLLLNDNHSEYYFALNLGNGYFNKVLAIDYTVHCQGTYADRHSILVNDFDHDGKSDIIVSKLLDGDISSICWLRSTGSALTEYKLVRTTDPDDVFCGRIILGDFTGNGELELMNYGNDIYTYSLNTNNNIQLRLYPSTSYSANSGKVRSITDGYGRTENITYKSATSPSVYAKGTGSSYPLCDLTLDIPAVSSVAHDNGAAGSYTQFYHYGGLKAHLLGRGLLGFSSVSVTDNATNAVTETTYGSLDTTYFIPLSDTTKTTLSDGSTSTVVTNYTITPKGAGNKNYLRLPTTVTSTDYDGYVTTTTRTFNTTNGYPLSENIAYGSSNKYRRTEYSQYAQYSGVWKPAKVTSSSRYSSSKPVFSTERSMTYDSHGLPLTVTENSHSTLALTTTYTYDAIGNVLSSVKSGLGVSPVRNCYEYDTENHFLKRTYTIPSSIEKNYTYTTWGDLLTETDNSNFSSPQTFSYDYDGWGRLTKTVSPTGAETRYYTGWGDDAAQRYFTVTVPDGGQWVKTWYDNCGREVATESRGLKNTVQRTATSYDRKGLVTERMSQVSSRLRFTTEYTYDTRGRLTSETSSTGSTDTYSYNHRTVTGTHDGRSFTKVYDAWGNVTSSYDSQTEVSMSYHSSGQPAWRQVYRSGGQSMTYDDVGNRISMTDNDAGTTTYEYNALGNLTRQTDARGKVTVNEYDALNRLYRTTIDGVAVNYTYGTSGNATGRLTSESMGNRTISYTYDPYGRVTQECRSFSPYQQYTFTNEYDTYGRVKRRTFPGNVSVLYEYDGYGNRIGEMKGDSTRLWHITSYNGLETEEQLGDTLVRRQVNDSNGYLSELSLRKGNILLRGLTHEYNPLTGNLTSREGMGGEILEEYTYDGTDRLTRYSVDSQDVLTIFYEPNGNIGSKTGVGTYTYNSGTTLPSAVQSVTNSSGMIPSSALTTEYNGFGKVTSIEDFHTMKRHEITYGPDLSRWVSENYTGNSMNSDRTYLGDLEISTYGPGEAVYFYYLDGGVVLMGTGGSQVTPYYLFTDHQGSVLNIYNGDGQEVFAATYDPWGRQTVTRNDIGFYRGYCGHEMITEFSLINMNGRIYDPVLGRFISPDNYVQEP